MLQVLGETSKKVQTSNINLVISRPESDSLVTQVEIGGWLAGWLGEWLGGWPAGWVPGWVARWLGWWLAGWPALGEDLSDHVWLTVSPVRILAQGWGRASCHQAQAVYRNTCPSHSAHKPCHIPLHKPSIKNGSWPHSATKMKPFELVPF